MSDTVFLASNGGGALYKRGQMPAMVHSIWGLCWTVFPSDRSIPGSTVFFRDVGLYFPVKLESAGGSTWTVFASTVDSICQQWTKFATMHSLNSALVHCPVCSVQQPWQKSFPQINRSIFANAESHLHTDPDIYIRQCCEEHFALNHWRSFWLFFFRLNILIQAGPNTWELWTGQKTGTEALRESPSLFLFDLLLLSSSSSPPPPPPLLLFTQNCTFLGIRMWVKML